MKPIGVAKKKFLSLAHFPNNALAVIAISLVISSLVFVNTPAEISPKNNPIQHIVGIMQENRSFDS